MGSIRPWPAVSSAEAAVVGSQRGCGQITPSKHASHRITLQPAGSRGAVLVQPQAAPDRTCLRIAPGRMGAVGQVEHPPERRVSGALILDQGRAGRDPDASVGGHHGVGVGVHGPAQRWGGKLF